MCGQVGIVGTCAPNHHHDPTLRYFTWPHGTAKAPIGTIELTAN